MSTPTFTCNACVAEFKSSDLQRYHMKTEWHRYNLKRRIAELAPISSDEFAEKLQISERERAEHQVDEFGFPLLKPVHPGHKTGKHHRTLSDIKSETTDESDINDYEDVGLTRTVSEADSVASDISRLTIESAETYGERTASEYGFTSDSNYEAETTDATDEEDTDSDELDSVHFASSRITQCIYCGQENKEINRNIKHMFQKHGLYIPERSYLIDLPGLLNFLYKLIIENYRCVCCNFIGSSVESIRAHMNSKRHCKMPYETIEEREVFDPFYDFSSLEQDNSIKRTAKSGKNIRFNVSSDEDEEEAASDGEPSAMRSNYTRVEIDQNNQELTLPTGTRLGHRSNQRPGRPHVSNADNQQRRAVAAANDRMMASGVTEKQFKKGIKTMQQQEKRAVDERLRKEMKRMNFQTYYRDELLQ